MIQPTPEAFAALARSSPWLWTTLRFTVNWPRDPHRTAELRAYLRRPDLLRVETTAGEVKQVVREPPSGLVSTATLRADGAQPYADGAEARADASPAMAPDSQIWANQPAAAPCPPWPGPPPELRPDGLITARPDDAIDSYDAPMYRDYSWVAMLDPVEMADGQNDPTTGARAEGTVIADTAEVDHGGRVAWEATVRPTAAYEPRCGCCSLMRDRATDLDEWGSDRTDVFLDEYPTGYRVRLDVGTGVCVLTEAIGGSIAGRGHDLRIEAVDLPMPDALFPNFPVRRERRRGWSKFPS